MAGFAGTRIDILNTSLGCRTFSGSEPLVIRRALRALGPDVLVVAAAGNHNLEPYRHQPTWPAASPGVVAVGATDANFSPELPWVSYVAPGTQVVSTYLDGAYARWEGTSFAAAVVSGAVAARTVPGQVSPAQALTRVLQDSSTLVTRYEYHDDGVRA
jgi:subtilisin family serine protease